MYVEPKRESAIELFLNIFEYIRLGYRQACENIEIFKMKLR